MAMAAAAVTKDGMPTAVAVQRRGRSYIDGSLADFVRQDNSDLLTRENAYVLDYSQVLHWRRRCASPCCGLRA